MSCFLVNNSSFPIGKAARRALVRRGMNLLLNARHGQNVLQMQWSQADMSREKLDGPSSCKKGSQAQKINENGRQNQAWVLYNNNTKEPPCQYSGARFAYHTKSPDFPAPRSGRRPHPRVHQQTIPTLKRFFAGTACSLVDSGLHSTKLTYKRHYYAVREFGCCVTTLLHALSLNVTNRMRTIPPGARERIQEGRRWSERRSSGEACVWGADTAEFVETGEERNLGGGLRTVLRMQLHRPS